MGSFDEIIRQKQAQFASPRSQDGGMNARDMAAVQMNAARGGPYSTAMAPPQQQAPMQQAPQQQMPQNGPIPSSRPMDAALAAQVNDGDADNTAAPMQGPPMPPATQQGDAQTMEAMQGPLAMALAAQMASGNGDPAQAAVDAAPQGAPQAAPVATTGPDTLPSGGQATGPFIAALASVGGIAGAAKLYKRYQMGDPDAANTFRAIGMHPDDFAMFADDPAASRGMGEATNAASGGKQDRAAPTQGAANQAVPQTKDAPMDAYPNAERWGNAAPVAVAAPKIEAPYKNVQTYGNVGAKNLPNSRPKMKITPKVKAK